MHGKERESVCVLVHPCDAPMRACTFLCPCWCVYSSRTALLSAAGMFSLSKASTDQREEQML